MSMAWEVTVEDVSTVLERHGIKKTKDEIDEIHDGLDFDEIEDVVVLSYIMNDSQCSAIFDEIENQLMEDGIIETKEKKFSYENDF